MLIKLRPTQVEQGQRFYFAGKEYVLATPEERRRHPSRGHISPENVMAYYIPEEGERIPVTFNPITDVFVDQK